MKPYIAILIDSFWEAVGNRVLWALLLCWSLLIAGLAPFGYVSERSFELTSRDISLRDDLLKKLARAVKGDGTEAQKAIAAQLKKEFAATLRKRESDGMAGPGPNRIATSRLAAELNAALDKRELYSEAAFPTAKARPRIKPLLDKPLGSLDKLELQELNRELAQIAFSSELRPPRGEQLWIGYAGFKLGESIRITRRQLKEFVENYVLAIIIKLGLAVVAVFVAIVVTSSILPDTIKSGSLHLLLSKPISRPLLYLSKFFGGCIFVLLNIAYLLIGLYFVVGWRFEIWNAGLLACIPLLLFVFVIFYSVSALIGVIWGNSIICVVACLVFWLFCTVVGGIRAGLQPSAEITPQIARFEMIGGELLAITQGGTLNVWNKQFSVWQPAVDVDRVPNGRLLGPIFDSQRRELLLRSDMRLPFGTFNTSSRRLSVVKFEPATDGEPSTDALDAHAANSGDPKDVAEAREKSRWLADYGPELPPQMMDLISLGNDTFAVTRSEIRRLDWNKVELSEAGLKLPFGLRLPGSQVEPFESVSPAGFELDDTVSVSVSPDNEHLFVYHSGTIDLLKYTKGRKLETERSIKLDGDAAVATLLLATPSACVVAREGLPLAVLTRQLESKHASIPVPGGTDVRQMALIPGSEDVSLITHVGTWIRLNLDSGQLTPVPNPWASKCTSAIWLNASRAWVGVKPDRAMLLNTVSGQVEQSLVPTPSKLDLFYRWVANPLYYVNPKPAALDEAMGYLLSGNKTRSLELMTSDLKAAQIELDVWQPIVSNLLFVIVMLTIGCIYIVRKEF